MQAFGAPVARWLAIAAAATCLVAMPVAMAIWNKSAPFFLVLAALLANVAALASMPPAGLLTRYRLIMSTGLSWLALSATVLAVASLGWTIDSAATLRGLIEALPEFVGAACLAAAWPAVARERDLALLKFGLLAALLLILFEAFAGMPIHRLVGARAEDYDLKRCVVPTVLLLWPCTELCLARGQRTWIVVLGLTVLLAAIVAHSSASVVAIVGSFAIYAVSRKWPTLTLWSGAAIAVVLLLASPWIGAITSSVLHPGGVALLAGQHADIRIGLWSNFGRHVFERLFLGHGFDASLTVSKSPLLGHAQDFPMVWNVHPHEIMLQVWVEFGLVGVLLALVAIVFCASRLARLTPPQRSSRLAFIGSSAAVALVGLNAWAPWWLAVVFTGQVYFLILRDQVLPGRQDADTR